MENCPAIINVRGPHSRWSNAVARQRCIVERNPFSFLPSCDDDDYRSLPGTSEEEDTLSEYDDDECICSSQVSSSSGKEKHKVSIL